jgi:enolase
LETGSRIKAVKAREVLTPRGPAVETTVLTENGAYGTNVVMGGRSVGKNEPAFLYDGGTRHGGRGVLKTVKNVNEIIAPSLKGIDVTEQRRIDETMISLQERNKCKLGVNSIASVSGAVVKSAAKSLGVPLYKYIGGENACIVPVPTIRALTGSRRYDGGERAGGKPMYDFVCYGFKTLSEAIQAGKEVENEFKRILTGRFPIFKSKNTFISAYEFLKTRLHLQGFFPDLEPALYNIIPRGKVESDGELWEAMTNAISIAGHENKVGIMVDVAAGCYYDDEKDRFVGLFSKKDKSREDLIDMYKNMVSTYPFLILEDPLSEQDFEGHAFLARKLNVEVIGDDLFAMNIKLLQKGIETSACNAMLLRVNQTRTITETLEVVQLAYRNGYGVMACGSRGEGVDIVDYAVGLCTGHMKGGGSGELARRLLEIEEELHEGAKFSGKDGITPKITKIDVAHLTTPSKC